MIVEDLSLILAIVSGSTVMASGVSVLLSAWRSSSSAKESRTKLASLEAREIIDESSFDELADAIYWKLGSTSVSNYSRDADVRRHFSKSFRAIIDFVGVGISDIRADSGVVEEKDDLKQHKRPMRTPEGRKAMDSITHGDAWTGLARMRRSLEAALSEMLGENQPPGRRRNLGSMIAQAEREGYVSESAVNDFRPAVATANRAIHGEDVDFAEAFVSVYTLDEVLFQLRDNRSLDGKSKN